MLRKRLTILFASLFFAFTFCVTGSAESETATEVKPVKKKTWKKAKKKAVKRSSAVSYKKKKKSRSQRLRKSLQAWLKKMKKRVARSHAKHNKVVSVAAVRGNETPDAPPLYWKGKKNKGPVDLPELNEFDGALDEALNGNKQKAITKLNKFIAAHPKSSLVDDANHTLSMLKEE